MADSDIVITEILYDAVNTVSDNNSEWVEIFNSGPDPVSLNGWTLDDSRTGNNSVGTIPNVTLQPGEIAIFITPISPKPNLQRFIIRRREPY